VWAGLSQLPPPLNDCLVFLEECTKFKVICVPGVFFDLNPRGTRNRIHMSTCIGNVRFSYGPPMDDLINGVKQMGEMIQYWRDQPESAHDYAESQLSGSGGSDV
jgi:hypothetical protein